MLLTVTFAHMSAPSVDDNWFEDWFDSPFYPLLYVHRSEQEAEKLIDNLVKILNIPSGAKILDLACGRGRHAVALAKRRFDVTGVDLSEESIRDAKKLEMANLQFHVHDMRRAVAINYFDATVNLFTSFGYFTTVQDNIRTLNAMHASLKKNGTLVIDYFNSECVRKLVAQSNSGEKLVDGIKFTWVKSIENDKVVKRITVIADGKSYLYTESVQLFSLQQFMALLDTQFSVTAIYGSYDLEPFDVNNSERMILRCSKK